MPRTKHSRDQPSTAEPDRQNRRAQALVAAAEAILAEAGPDGLSARSVADRAGVNKGLVFYYWGSADGLFEEVLARYYQRHKDALESAMAQPGPLAGRIHRVVDEYLDFMERNQSYARIVQQQVSSGGRHLALVERHLSEVFAMAMRIIEPVAAPSGPGSARHLFMSLSASVINYFTYAPVLGQRFWGVDPLGRAGLAERRAHVHWLIDAWLAALDRSS